MSFSTTTKTELARLPVDKDCCQGVALATFLELSGTYSSTGTRSSVVVSSENAAIARRFYQLSKKFLGCAPVISVSRRNNFKKNNVYSVRIPMDRKLKGKLKAVGLSVEEHSFKTTGKNGKGDRGNFPVCCSRVYLRSAFLAAGSVINPQRGYHLEIAGPSKEAAGRIAAVMERFDLKPGLIRRKQLYVVYLKEADQIADFLNVIGAHTALLNMESIRTIKGMRNKVNRLINCETANINKSINASLKQIENINLIRGTVGLERLPESLRKIAVLRLENPEASLKELGEMLDPPVGKSGVNHRMRKIEEIVDKINGRDYGGR